VAAWREEDNATRLAKLSRARDSREIGLKHLFMEGTPLMVTRYLIMLCPTVA